MANPEWGAKRICSSCGTKFYDLRRTPITCPKCETPYVPEPPPKPRRSAAPEAKVKPLEATVGVEADSLDAAAVVAADVIDEDKAIDKDKAIDEDKSIDEDDGNDKGLKNGKADKDAGVIEDPSELGEDEDDMAEVIDGIENDKA